MTRVNDFRTVLAFLLETSFQGVDIGSSNDKSCESQHLFLYVSLADHDIAIPNIKNILCVHPTSIRLSNTLTLQHE